MASQVAARMLIETVQPLVLLGDDDFCDFEKAIGAREARHGRPFDHYRQALYASRAVIYHLGAPAEPAPKRSTLARWSWERHLDGIGPQIRGPMVAYLERLEGTLSRSSVQGTASELAHFGRFLARVDPRLSSLALLDRRRHIEPYLNEVQGRSTIGAGCPSPRRPRRVGSRPSAGSSRRWPSGAGTRPRLGASSSRGTLLDSRTPCRATCRPGRSGPCCRLSRLPNRLYADALLLLRETGLRIGELCDLELDCVHEIPGQGAWMKVPLGKLLTERMVPIDEETVELIDRIAIERSPGRPLRHPRSGKLVEFLLTHQGRRVSACTLRDELHRAAREAGLKDVVPHQLRHTFATAMVNAGCSLQALMELLGHRSAEMSLRYGRLFDQTVRDNYERALAQAKAHLGPVLPDATPVHLETDWRAAPLIKARLAAVTACAASPRGRAPTPTSASTAELPLRGKLPSGSSPPARRRRRTRCRRRGTGMGRGGGPPPPAHRANRRADLQGKCQLTKTT